MLTNQLFDQHVTVQNRHEEHSDLSRLLAAAVVSRQFRQLLLSEPARAISQGYGGESFTLSAEEYHLVTSARAASLPEFAQLLSKYVPETRSTWKPALSEIHQLRI